MTDTSDELTRLRGPLLPCGAYSGPIMKNQQGAPEALRLADLLRQQAAYHREVASDCDMRAENTINWGHGEVCCRAADELLRLHAYCQELEAQVILDCMTHGQQSAEIEHVVGDVSKNGAESNMAQQPAPSAAAADIVELLECSGCLKVGQKDRALAIVARLLPAQHGGVL